MNAMTLLRAMSTIDPHDIEAALTAGDRYGNTQIRLKQTTADAEAAVYPLPHPKNAHAGRRYAVGGWVAAAACIALIAAAGLFFRSRDDQMLVQSGSEAVTEIAGESSAVPAQIADDSTSGSAQTGPDSDTLAGGAVDTDTQQSALPNENEPVPQEPDAGTTQAPQNTETAPPAFETSAAQTEPVQQKNIPVLIAMSDGKGSMTHPDGSPFAEAEVSWKILRDTAEIRAYLNRTDPEVTLGTGKKPDDIRDAILTAPEMLAVSWQMPDDRWMSYGIQKAELDADGVLHLTVGMYSDDSAVQPEPWIYETALLYEAGMLPAVTDVKIDAVYYIDTDETGIQNYLLFDSTLEDDVNIRVTGS